MKTLPLVLAASLAIAGCGRLSRGKPATPPPAAPTVVVPGISFDQVTVTKFSEHPRLWIYIPDDKKRRHPCVVIAAAGSKLINGMNLSEADQPEHLPYAKAGYVVVAYEVSGKRMTGTPEEDSIRLFGRRNAGIDNGKSAIDYALKNLPIDPIRLYAVGHSSAATLALQLAAADSRIRGCVAYAPVTDVPAFVGPEMMARLGQLGHMDRLIRGVSPSANIAKVKCPVMLFTAEDDRTVPTDTVKAYADALRKRNADVALVTAESGGHYDSMLKKGIPAGLQWLGRSRKPRK